MSITFRTNELNSKWGLGDGDMLDDLLEEHGVLYQDDRAHHLHNHAEILARVVERFVLPAIVRPEHLLLDRIACCHNPIRTEEEENISPITVDVAVKDILEVAREVERERGRD